VTESLTDLVNESLTDLVTDSLVVGPERLTPLIPKLVILCDSELVISTCHHQSPYPTGRFPNNILYAFLVLPS